MNIILQILAASPVVLFGLGWGAMSMSPPEYSLARGLMIGSAISAIIWNLSWLRVTDEALLTKIVLGASIGLVSLGGLPLGLNWIDRREKLNSPTPVISASSNQTATIQGPTLSPPTKTAPLSCDDLIIATGSSFPIGYIPPPTEFVGFTSKEILSRLSSLRKTIIDKENQAWTRIAELSKSFRPARLTDDQYRTQFQAVSAQKDQEETNWTLEFRKYLDELRSLHNELLTRLKMPFPRCSSSGLSIEGYRALMTGLVSNNGAAKDLVTYLTRLSESLPIDH